MDLIYNKLTYRPKRYTKIEFIWKTRALNGVHLAMLLQILLHNHERLWEERKVRSGF